MEFYCRVVGGQKNIYSNELGTNLVAAFAVAKPRVVLLVVAFHALPVVGLRQFHVYGAFGVFSGVRQNEVTVITQMTAEREASRCGYADRKVLKED